jgi:hypothetical protein
LCSVRETRANYRDNTGTKEEHKIHAETTDRKPIKEKKETTKIQASKTKLMKINRREYYKNLGQGDTIKILKEENTNFEINTWPFTFTFTFTAQKVKE